MSSTEKTLSTKVRERLRELGVQKGARLSIAYSGGPDSTALLYIAAAIRDRMGVRLRAFFVDHGIRSPEERTAEGALVIRTTCALEIPLMSLYLPAGYVAERAKKHGGTEAAARFFRYDFFEGAAAEEDDYVLLAHTLDDQMETQIMRFFQGSGPGGLAGMPERRGPFLRPLLSVGKGELCGYLSEIGAEYSVDSSNSSQTYLRNRVRTELMPVARSVFPGMERALAELAEKMRSHGGPESVLDFSIEEQKNGERGKLSFDADAFAAATDAQRRGLIYRMWDYLHGEESRRLPHRFLRNFFRSFDDIYNEAKKNGAKYREAEETAIAEGHGIRMDLRGGRIFCRTNVVREQKKSYLTKIEEGVVEIGDGIRIFVYCGTLEEDGAEAAESGKSVELYSSRTFGPCVLRSRREGDTIRLSGGEVKLKELMGRLRIPSGERWRYPVVEDRRGILALLNLYELPSSVIGSLGGEKPENGLYYRIQEV